MLNSLNVQHIVEIARNEVILNDDINAFPMKSEPDPLVLPSFGGSRFFLSDTNVEKKLVSTRMDFVMSPRVQRIERHAFTWLELLAEFGGYSDALFMIGAFLLAPYSELMYSIATATGQPVHANPSKT